MGSRGEADVGLRDVKVGGGMPGFGPSPSAASIGSDGNSMHLSQVSGIRGSEQSMRQHIGDAIDSSRSALHFDANSVDQSTADPLKFASFSRGMFVTSPLINDCRTISSDDANPPAIRTRAAPMLQSCQQNGQHPNILSGENWGESPMADTSPRTDTSTEDTDDKSQRLEGGQVATLAASDSSDRSKEKSTDQKTLRRLAQNREAARKSRLRKKAYVQQLENSRLKLTQLEQELHRARQQGIFISSLGDQSHSVSGNGALTFDMEYGRWLEEHNRQTNELRAAVNSHASDTELRTIVDGIMAHYKDIFRLKGIAAKADVFHVLSGMWKTPAERCFLWLGGFRSSELLKLLASQLEPLTEQQLKGIRNLQESSQQAEDALSQGMEALLQSLTETLASGSLGSSGSSGNVANYMGQMALAMGKLGTLENFLIQADNLRQQTMEQLLRILTTRQAARALLAISDYFSRLRALSSLWLARPRE